MWDKLRFQIFWRIRCELQFVPNSNELGRRVVRFRAKDELRRRWRHLENFEYITRTRRKRESMPFCWVRVWCELELRDFLVLSRCLWVVLLKKEKGSDCIGYLLGYWIVGWWASGNWNKWIGNIGLVQLYWNDFVDGIVWELESLGRFESGLLEKAK